MAVEQKHSTLRSNVPLAMFEIKKNTAAESQSYTSKLYLQGSLGPEGSGFLISRTGATIISIINQGQHDAMM